MTGDSDAKRDAILAANPRDAWAAVFGELWEIFSAPLTVTDAEREIAERERKVAELELLLSGSAWELWRDFEHAVPRTAQSVVEFWTRVSSGKATCSHVMKTVNEVDFDIALLSINHVQPRWDHQIVLTYKVHKGTMSITSPTNFYKNGARADDDMARLLVTRLGLPQ